MSETNRTELLHHLIDRSAKRTPTSEAIVMRGVSWDYASLANQQDKFAAAVADKTCPGSRVAIWLSKSMEWVVAAFGTSKAGRIFVPVNPVLKAPQVGHIARDCEVEMLITSIERLNSIREELEACPSIKTVVLVDKGDTPSLSGISIIRWDDFCSDRKFEGGNLSANDIAAIFYTSGSTGLPKGVVVPHRSLVTGAASVAEYLQQRSSDRILAAMPLSFDAGFSQLTTCFFVGACCVLLDYFHPAEVVRTIISERITGLTGVPPFWAQMITVKWPEEGANTLRYFATTGGRMPRDTLNRVRKLAPAAAPYLMYGLTEAFRSTFLEPDEIDNRVDSIGKAIPGQTIYIAREDGSRCEPNEIGELVHMGPTVCLGYWNNPQATAKRFRTVSHPCNGVILKETAVFSGDYAMADKDGYLYFVGRSDDMIKSSGYRISPHEIEEAVYATGLVDDVIAYGIPDERVGHRVGISIYSTVGDQGLDIQIRNACREILPNYMVPRDINIGKKPFPRNVNGKLDRITIIRQQLNTEFEECAA